MTVVATDGVHIASDSLTTFGPERGLRPTKKIIVRESRIYTASGVSILPILVEWHCSGADPEKLPVVGKDDNWTLMVIDANGYHLYWNSLPYPEEVDPPFAIGSGGDYAVGAMDHGASAEEAVAIAIRRSNSCGGPIQVVNIAEALGQLRQAAE